MFSLLLMAMAVPSYTPPPRAERETRERCNVALLAAQQFVAQYHSFVTTHEIDEGGGLTPEEAVVYRAMGDNVVRPYFDEIRYLRNGIGGLGERCENLAEEAKDKLLYEVILPGFGEAHSYYQTEDGWKKLPRR